MIIDQPSTKSGLSFTFWKFLEHSAFVIFFPKKWLFKRKNLLKSISDFFPQNPWKNHNFSFLTFRIFCWRFCSETFSREFVCRQKLSFFSSCWSLNKKSKLAPTYSNSSFSTFGIFATGSSSFSNFSWNCFLGISARKK